jgi:hypothetical protein
MVVWFGTLHPTTKPSRPSGRCQNEVISYNTAGVWPSLLLRVRGSSIFFFEF